MAYDDKRQKFAKELKEIEELTVMGIFDLFNGDGLNGNIFANFFRNFLKNPKDTNSAEAKKAQWQMSYAIAGSVYGLGKNGQKLKGLLSLREILDTQGIEGLKAYVDGNISDPKTGEPTGYFGVDKDGNIKIPPLNKTDRQVISFGKMFKNLKAKPITYFLILREIEKDKTLLNSLAGTQFLTTLEAKKQEYIKAEANEFKTTVSKQMSAISEAREKKDLTTVESAESAIRSAIDNMIKLDPKTAADVLESLTGSSFGKQLKSSDYEMEWKRPKRDDDGELSHVDESCDSINDYFKAALKERKQQDNIIYERRITADIDRFQKYIQKIDGKQSAWTKTVKNIQDRLIYLVTTEPEYAVKMSKELDKKSDLMKMFTPEFLAAFKDAAEDALKNGYSIEKIEKMQEGLTLQNQPEKSVEAEVEAEATPPVITKEREM